jgi:hypothetical protein
LNLILVLGASLKVDECERKNKRKPQEPRRLHGDVLLAEIDVNTINPGEADKFSDASR